MEGKGASCQGSQAECLRKSRKRTGFGLWASWCTKVREGELQVERLVAIYPSSFLRVEYSQPPVPLDFRPPASFSKPGRPSPDAAADSYVDSMNGSQSRNPSDSAMHDARGRKPSQAAPMSNSNTMTRAERFEDEKRRMVESCFSKLDQNGQCMLNCCLDPTCPTNIFYQWPNRTSHTFA